ncbi:MAG: hypothetical protein CMB99_04475 [Flavobacteriaceae bacterium]|nr:hypothetical protein [Flavobacteriaceae bacterium]|tara:strand:+ start:37136 stop:40171 length:3036 start_codon:yes stop_codon:yes gene_type:complete
MVKTVRILFSFLFLLATTDGLLGQQSNSPNNLNNQFDAALKLYNNKAYAAAQLAFLDIANTAEEKTTVQADASYYDAMCAVKLNQTDADNKVLQFVEAYPNSNKKNIAFFNVANYYFANKKAAHALKWFQKVNTDYLSKENKNEMFFKMGYGFLLTKRLDLAKEKFLPLLNDGKYGNDSRYYYGYIAYKLEDYGIAESTLKEIADNDSYKAEISYYLLDISFKAGKFNRCILVGEELLKDAKRKDVSEISKIVGESYFNIQKYGEAIPYLKAYKGKRGKWNNTDYYILGYAYYKQNDFENAIRYFNKIIVEKNAVAQNAYYHLGQCYLDTEKKAEALNAFKSASSMNFDGKIKEDAALNYAKLSYEEGNPFEPVAQVLQNFLKDYPNSKNYEEINGLVVSSYIHQQDFQGALDYLKKRKTPNNRKYVYEVSLYRGIQLLNENKLTEAYALLKTSTRSDNPEIYHSGKYWLAESQYRLGDYEDAISKWKEMKLNTPKDFEYYQLLDYQIAYAYFKIKDYENSSVFFNQYLKQNLDDYTYQGDATMRLADSYYAITKYSNAINTYKKIIDNEFSGKDYARYQIAMSYGFMNEDEQKIQSLKKLVNEFTVSNLKDDALFQLGITYTKMKNHQEAHGAYDRLISKYPRSPFVSRTLIRQGLLYYNDDMNAKALEKYKRIASDFPNTKEALQAVTNAKNIYIDENNLDEYVRWVNTLSFVKVSDDEIDNSTFGIAEKNYLEGINKGIIIRNLERYLDKYPTGNHFIKANFYLGNVLFETKEYARAKPYFLRVLEEGVTEYREISLAKTSQILLELNNVYEAIPWLEKLEKEAYETSNVLFAQSNLMKAYYTTKSYKLALEFAKKVLSKDVTDPTLNLDAKIIIARVSYKTDDIDTAREYFENIEKEATGELKAESIYYNALFTYEDGAYEDSNRIIQDLISKYSNYKYWGVKSYIVMAKNYYKLKDAYQATFILENIIKNFSQFEELVKEAETELKLIKEKEAKTNTSITTTNKNK